MTPQEFSGQAFYILIDLTIVFSIIGLCLLALFGIIKFFQYLRKYVR